MKAFFTVLMLCITSCVIAQTNALHAGVYSWSNAPVKKTDLIEKREVLKGKTLDLQKFEIYTLTLGAGKAYIPPDTNSKYEELIIVKSGDLQLTVKGSTKLIGPGSIALILAGDKVDFKNISTKPVTWFIINYQSINPVDIKRGNDAGSSFIKNWKELVVSTSSKGESRPVFDRTTSMFGRFDVHATALNPGYASHAPHTHRVEELILMLRGKVKEQIGQDKFDAKEGDCIFLTSGILHAPKNIFDQQCNYFAIQWHNLKTD